MDYTALSPEDLVVACLQASNELAWAEFIQRFHPLISKVAFRVARQWGEASPQIVDDLIQETYLKLCADQLRALQSFKSAHKDAIYGFIKIFTANLVHDHFKSAHTQKRGGGIMTDSLNAESEYLPEASSSSAVAIERDLLIQEVDACLQVVISGPDSERDRRIFWLYYRVGLGASSISALPTIGLTTKGVESTILRLTRQVRERLSGRPEVSSSIRPKGIRPAESL